jgi:hypothetical protein
MTFTLRQPKALAQLGEGKRFIVRVDEMLTAFLELERAIHQFAVDAIS